MTNPELKQAMSFGGFNNASGKNRKYIPSRQCWSVEYTTPGGTRVAVFMKRKCDAVAVFRWMLSTEWNGWGDYTDIFMSWLWENDKKIASTFKGEI